MVVVVVSVDQSVVGILSFTLLCLATFTCFLFLLPRVLWNFLNQFILPINLHPVIVNLIFDLALYWTPKMPILVINTNLSTDQIPRDALPELTKLVADMLDKPAQYVNIQVNANQIMTSGGTFDPCALLELRSIGKIDPITNQKSAQVLTNYFSKKFNIPANRFFIEFIDIHIKNISFQGTFFG